MMKQIFQVAKNLHFKTVGILAALPVIRVDLS